MQELKIEYLVDAQEHLPSLNQWLHDEWDHMYPGSTVETRAARMKLRLNRDKIPIAVVASIDGKTVGTASLTRADMDTHPEFTPWLATVYVSSEFRGRGAGSKLVRRIIEEARGLGFEKFYLWTDKEEKLYASLGWKLEFREEYKGMAVSVMSYDLTAKP